MTFSSEKIHSLHLRLTACDMQECFRASFIGLTVLYKYAKYLHLQFSKL